MDYEKLHKDTIAKLQEMVNSGKITVETARGICSDFVPESEDKRIIRRIRLAVEDHFSSEGIVYHEDMDNVRKEIYDWLEKQGNQKPKRMESAEAKEAMYDKPAWSEEDEKISSRVYDLIHAAAYANYDVDEDEKELGEYAKITNWFKSLKERHTWKPSEEQMKELEHFVRNIGESGYASPYDNNTKLLYSLLSDLKKLK